MKTKLTKLILIIGIISIFLIPIATAIPPIKVNVQGQLSIHIANQTGPITGCTTPRVSVMKPISIRTPNSTLTAGEIGGGFYVANYTPSEIGTFRAHFACSLGGNNYTIQDLFEVVNEFIDDKFNNITSNFTNLGTNLPVDIDTRLNTSHGQGNYNYSGLTTAQNSTLSNRSSLTLSDFGYSASSTTLKTDMTGLSDDINKSVFLIKTTGKRADITVREITSSKEGFREFALEVRPTGITTNPDVFLEITRMDKEDIILHNIDGQAFSFKTHNSVKGNMFIEFNPLLDDCKFESQLDAIGRCEENEFLLFLKKDKLDNITAPIFNLESPKSTSLDATWIKAKEAGDFITPGAPLVGVGVIAFGVLLVLSLVYVSIKWMGLQVQKEFTTSGPSVDDLFGFKRRR